MSRGEPSDTGLVSPHAHEAHRPNTERQLGPNRTGVVLRSNRPVNKYGNADLQLKGAVSPHRAAGVGQGGEKRGRKGSVRRLRGRWKNCRERGRIFRRHDLFLQRPVSPWGPQLRPFHSAKGMGAGHSRQGKQEWKQSSGPKNEALKRKNPGLLRVPVSLGPSLCFRHGPN